MTDGLHIILHLLSHTLSNVAYWMKCNYCIYEQRRLSLIGINFRRFDRRAQLCNRSTLHIYRALAEAFLFSVSQSQTLRGKYRFAIGHSLSSRKADDQVTGGIFGFRISIDCLFINMNELYNLQPCNI